MRRLLVVSFMLVLMCAFPATGRAIAHPVASFDWSMPDRFGLDDNHDGVIDYYPETSSLPGLTGEIDPGTFRVDLDGCATSGDHPIASYAWVVAGAQAVRSTSCTISRQLAEGTYPVTLTVTDNTGVTDVLTKSVIVQDWLIVALGDSYGSGEGSPDIFIPLPALQEIDAAQRAKDDAQANYGNALADLTTIQTRFDNTVAAAAAIAAPCGWSDSDGNGTYDKFDLLSVDVVGCTVAVVQLGIDAVGDFWNLVGEAVNDSIAVARAALGVAQADVDATFATLGDFIDQLANLQNTLHPTWEDRRCHRSARAGSAQAALAIERADPRTSVTFVHLACSGAEANNGFLNPYQGVKEEVPNAPLDCVAHPNQCVPPQIARAAQLVGSREVDALFMSIGGNDANFAPIVQACIVLEPCNVPPARTDPVILGGIAGICTTLIGPVTLALVPVCVAYLNQLVIDSAGDTADHLFADGIAELAPQADRSGLYQQVADRFATLLPKVTHDRVYLSEYPNATQDDDLSYCPDINPLNNLPGLSLSETVFADSVVTHGLDNQVRTNALDEGWNFIGGVYDAFAGHGYCADDHWITRFDETFRNQGNHTGVVHPNPKGQAAYRDLIRPAIQNGLYVGGDLNAPRRPAQPPVADAGGPYFTSEGSTITLDGSGSYSPDGDPFTYAWSPTSFANGVTLSGATTAAPTLHAVDDGSLTVTLTATDDDGSDAAATVVHIQNVAPTVSAGADASVAEGVTFSRAGSFTDPSPVDTHTATVDYGDGSGVTALPVTALRTFSLSHVYADNGTFVVEVCVTDDDGGSGCDTANVTVSNVAPVVAAGADRSATEGSAVSLASVGFSDKGTADTHSATVSWGDGTGVGPAGVSESPFGPPGSTAGASGTVSGTHVYADNGAYTVNVCVTDDDGATGCDSLIVTVGNVAPVVDAGLDRTTNEGSIIALAPATFRDKGTLDTHTAAVTWGDGSATSTAMVSETPSGPPGSTAGAGGSAAAIHIYRDNGVYTVTVCVADDDGGVGCDTLVVTVLNVPPSLVIGQVAAGAPFALTSVPISVLSLFTDPGALDTQTATINWGDGLPLQLIGSVTSPFSATHAYAAAGFYTITVRVTDDDGGADTKTAVIEVVSPTVALNRSVASLYSLSTDPGTNALARSLILQAIDDLYGNGGTSGNGAFTLLQTGHPGAALEKIEQAELHLNAAVAADSDLNLGQIRLVLAWVAKSVANDVVARADARAVSSGDRKTVLAAKALIAQGDVLLAAGDYPRAVDAYQKAAGKVEKLLG